MLLKTFHAESLKDPSGWKAEYARGNLMGWRSTLHTLYRESAEDIVSRVVIRTRLAIPGSEVPSGGDHGS